jgi:trk system potassium uptake protein TrkH
VIVLSFATLITLGTLLLALPVSSKTGSFTPLLDAFFTATSATCVTGLVVYDTFTHWSPFGQWVILGLIQIGGIGLVTFTTFFNLLLGRKLGLRSMQLAQESVNTRSFADIRVLVRTVFAVTIAVESLGAWLLSFYMIPRYGEDGLFISVFMAISAFCNAGFDVLGRRAPYVSLMEFSGCAPVLGIVMMLIVVGGLGFVVWHDLYQYMKTRRLILHTRIVLIVTGVLIAAGTLGVLVLEWGNPQTLGPMNLGEKLVNALFQSVTSRTAGFNTVDTASLTGLCKAFVSMMMFIGAAPASTGGGIKLTTFAVLAMTVLGVVLGREDTVILGRRVDQKTVYKALAIAVLGLMIVTLCTLILFLGCEYAGRPVSATDAFFESVSAFGTVGLSAGVTAHAGWFSKLTLIFSMFVGRVGPVSLGFALAVRGEQRKQIVIPDGQILVG